MSLSHSCRTGTMRETGHYGVDRRSVRALCYSLGPIGLSTCYILVLYAYNLESVKLYG